ncbi:hypothetical protein XENOCAPTIV_022324 [Xenoophorus captivus]|uniref:Uncharacterized protein n=1 Tax=Xenoophorus captivus TaxID=1517983 RepID=A0ABV0QJL4_9TELE
MMQTLDLEVNMNLQPLVCFSSFLNVRKHMVMYFIIQPPHLQKGRTDTLREPKLLLPKPEILRKSSQKENRMSSDGGNGSTLWRRNLNAISLFRRYLIVNKCQINQI